MRVPAAVRLALAAIAEQRARRSTRRVGIVLVYHRIAEASGSPALELSPAVGRSAFRREVAYLSRRYRIVAPSEIPASMASRKPGERLPVAITFDDDTRSHLDEAAPVLEAHRVVGGFYVGGWTLHGALPPWWESLQLAVDHARIPGGLLPADQTAAALARKPGAIRLLGALVEGLEPDVLQVVRQELAAATSDLARDQGLDERALRVLAAGHELGFHPPAHDRLQPLGDEQLAAALTAGRADLERVIGKPLRSIAYPHGSADARVADRARAAGYELGFAGSNRAACATDDPLLLPRLDPWHTSLATFAATLAAAALTRSPPAPPAP
jgi:peptidoglycan/xylan/chitin deacetylase (PgdA/CDA1 family)